MPPLPRSLLGREVIWKRLVPSHDERSMFYKETTGVIIDTHWEGNAHFSLITDNTQFYIIRTDHLTFVNTDAKVTTPVTKNQNASGK